MLRASMHMQFARLPFRSFACRPCNNMKASFFFVPIPRHKVDKDDEGMLLASESSADQRRGAILMVGTRDALHELLAIFDGHRRGGNCE